MAQGKHLMEKEKSDGKAQKKAWVMANIVVTLSLFIGITVMLIVFERPTHSDIEKRDLAEFPDFSAEAFFSGEFTSKVSNWFNDTVPWRDGFKNISANIMKYTGISSGSVGQLILPSPTKPNTPQATEPSKTDPTEQQPSQSGASTGNSDPNPVQSSGGDVSNEPVTEAPVHKPGIDIDNDGMINNGQYIYEYQGHAWGVQLYGGGYNRELYVRSVNAFAEDLDGIAKVYSMIPPTNGDFYTPLTVLNNDPPVTYLQLPDIQYIADNLSDKVISVDCYTALEQHTDEYIYLRTDHHWTPLGAYYAAQEFAKAAGVPFAELNEENFEYRTIEGGMVGSLYTTTQSALLLNDPDEFTYYVPNNDFKTYYYDTHYENMFQYPFFLTDQAGSNCYGVFMGADNKIVRVETDVKNGRKLLIFKDSYGNAEPPFYMNSFETIYVCDVRFFALNAIDFIKQEGVTDVLFTMNTFSAAGQNCEGIELNRLGQGPLLDW